MTLTRRLAAWAVGVASEQLPAHVVDCATYSVLDTLGCTLAGVETPVATAVRDTMLGLRAVGGSTTLGLSQTLPAAHAAFANSTAAHSLELDDTDSAGFCHPGAVVVPAALAAAEAYGSDGREFLTSVIVGYEVTVRLARWLNPHHRLRGFHTTATVPTIGAAAAVARLAGMDAPGAISALGIAASFASGTFAFLGSGSNIKRAHAGKAAHGALLSVDLAQHGVEGPADALEGDAGVFATMAGPNVTELDLEDLGKRFVITEVGRKPYACCRFCHAAIDSAVVLHDRGVPVAECRRITVTVSRLCAEQTGLTSPVNELQRQFSTPYGVALGLLNGGVTLSDYRDKPNERALRLARRIEVTVNHDLAVSDRTARIVVADRTGTRWVSETPVPRGEPSNPIPTDVLRNKFFDLSTTTMTGRRAHTTYDAVLALTETSHLDQLSAGLRQDES